MLLTGVEVVFCVVGLVLLIAAALAPLEALQWWIGWSGRPAPDAPLEIVNDDAAVSQASAYVVYLSGVAAMNPSGMHEKESAFLDTLQRRLQTARVVRDVFAYSVTNNPLTGERQLAPLWQWVNRLSIKRGKTLLEWAALGLVILRNLLQILVSADYRYGPIYSFGIAKETVEALLRQGYTFGSRAPIILLGYSGGGQVAIACAPYVRRLLQRPVWVIGIGGVYGDSAGVLSVRHLYQLAGEQDYTQYLGDVIFPGHWAIFPYSAWNRAKRKGKISFLKMGPMKHTLSGDYFSRSAKLPNGQTHVEKTVETIAEIVESIE
jgi:hypothetical protein